MIDAEKLAKYDVKWFESKSFLIHMCVATNKLIMPGDIAMKGVGKYVNEGTRYSHHGIWWMTKESWIMKRLSNEI